MFLSASTFQQLFRYSLFGLINNAAIYLFYLLFTYLGAAPKIAMSFLYLIGTVTGFIGNKKFTFAHYANSPKLFYRYVITQVVGYLINLIILIVMVDIFAYPHQFIQAISIILVAGFLFLMYKFYVFNLFKTNLENTGETLP